ncbi:ripening-related protein precursor [Iris pallida]|uniref:Ripening-related protein n=1 Tax=Iris pallida TaxID=29817 RepID=A0AAX6GV56_IRIPA|nr:ripening-related protein precursor [Iris pallida]KAJ6832195.1 ripening-related protein precursor [Iris pallida]KAJ6849662.1 ripening-related protein precursor [Iris pallida]
MEAAVANNKFVSLTLFLIFAFLLNLSSASSHHRPSPTEFIRTSCRSTRYPSVCEKSLSSYAPSVRHSPRQLAHAALSVSADRARAASSFVGRLSSPPAGRSPRSGRGGGAIRDCLDTLADSVDRLRRSDREMRRMGRRGTRRFEWHLGNVQTWVSAALTDETTCLDSLSEDSAAGAGARAQIRNRILDVARVTSNALALVNHLQGRN